MARIGWMQSEAVRISGRPLDSAGVALPRTTDHMRSATCATLRQCLVDPEFIESLQTSRLRPPL
eukprot:5934763-Alexandrium_andersonii.AAC.1